MSVPSLSALFQSLFGPSGPRLGSGQDELNFFNLLFSSATGITAHAGGGQASATPLTSAINNVTVVATAADSVMLPPALPGLTVRVVNGVAANSLQVFGQPTNPNTGVGDTIIAHGSSVASATATGVAQAAPLAATYFCIAPGVWKQSLSA